jgi:acetyl esterase/lipase
MQTLSRNGMTRSWLLILLGLFSPLTVAAVEGQEVPLYKDEIPGAISAPDNEYVFSSDNNDIFIAAVSRPTLTAYFPNGQSRTGAAVVICPGGGYFGLSSIKEGRDVAQRFAENGVAAFVLKYRLPDDKIMADKTTAPLQDVQQAIYQVRQHSAQWQIKPDQVGVMGFSAGGHLASTAATHFSAPVRANLTPAQVRPDFQILLYPVITMREGITHQSCRDFVLGEADAEELVAT